MAYGRLKKNETKKNIAFTRTTQCNFFFLKNVSSFLNNHKWPFELFKLKKKRKVESVLSSNYFSSEDKKKNYQNPGPNY